MKRSGILALRLGRELVPELLAGLAMVALGLYPLVTQDRAEAALGAVMFPSAIVDRAMLWMASGLLAAGLGSLGVVVARARGTAGPRARYPAGHPG
jgi:hypothetical protein